MIVGSGDFVFGQVGDLLGSANGELQELPFLPTHIGIDWRRRNVTQVADNGVGKVDETYRNVVFGGL